MKYWLFYAPSTSITSTDWINIPGSRALLNVTSPYVVTGLANGYTYSFTVNGRNGDGPGGAGNQFVDPHVGAVALEPGDLFLLCSDGLVEGLYNHHILDLLRPTEPADPAANPARRR